MGDAKFKLEDILNKQKAPPQILDLAHIKIESEADFRGVIEKIPDYRIKPERVRDLRKFFSSIFFKKNMLYFISCICYISYNNMTMVYST